MEKNWFVIVNPKSGGGKASRLWDKIAPMLSAEHIQTKAVFTQKPQHAIDLVAEGLSEGFRNFIAVGGDGTISEVVNGIFQQKEVDPENILLSVFPSGTGNDWARYYKLPGNAKKLIHVLTHGQTKVQDIGRITYQENGKDKVRYFNNVAGMGFESFVTKETEDINKVGFFGQTGYLLGVLSNLFKFKSPTLSIKTKNLAYEKPCLLFTIGLCRFNGNGMNLVPRSRPDDHLFDLTILDEISPWNVLRHILKIYNGRIYHHPKAFHHRTDYIEVNGDEGAFIEADGEVLGAVPIKIELLPDALQILVP